MASVPPQPPLVAWMEVLDRIEQAVQESLARAAGPEPPPETPGGASHVAKLALEVLTARQDRLQAILDRAGQDAARADAALTGEVEEVERWLLEGCAVRERLGELGHPRPFVTSPRQDV
jgi:hypothetical protein